MAHFLLFDVPKPVSIKIKHTNLDKLPPIRDIHKMVIKLPDPTADIIWTGVLTGGLLVHKLSVRHQPVIIIKTRLTGRVAARKIPNFLN